MGPEPEPPRLLIGPEYPHPSGKLGDHADVVAVNAGGYGDSC